MAVEEHLIEELSKRSQGAADLAKLVSLAVLIEPQLLRRARINLLPEVDAGAEADLWLSPLVQTRSPRGITLLPRAAEHLRLELAKDTVLFDKAWKLTSEAHKSSPPTVKLEENINRLSVKLDGDSLKEIESLLRSVVSTLVDHEERWGLAHWAAGALARMPEEVRRLEPARVLTAASYLRLNSHMPAESGGAPNSDLPEWLSWVMPKNMSDSEFEFGLGVQLVEGGVRLGGSAGPNHTIPVPDTNPLLVELSWPEDGGRRVRQVRLEKGEQRVVAAPADGVQLRTMTGLCYAIIPAAAVEDEAPVTRKVCFVSMPFGEKVDLATGRKLNMDAVYRSLIKPSVEGAGFECVRADEIVHSGVIDLPMYEQLLKADVVISDLSTSSPSVFYELGVRHALRPYTTILIAEDQFRFPHDFNSIRILTYKHLGDDIGYSEVMRFTSYLKQVLTATYEQTPRKTDSPVYTYLNGLTPPQLEETTQSATQAATQNANAPPDTVAAPAQSYGELMRQADEARAKRDFITEVALLSQIRSNAGDDPYVIRRLALATDRSRQPTPQLALEEARELLLTLNPETSNDTETLGLWGSVHKRLWEETHERKYLDEAVRGYKRGFYVRNDYSNGNTLAYLLNVRAAASADERAEAIADFVQAGRVRRAVLSICEKALAAENVPDDERFWVLATMGEALLGLGDEEGARRRLEEAYSHAPAEWMTETVKEQIEKLRALISDSPLRYLREDEQ